MRGNLLTGLSLNVYWPCRTSWGLFLMALSHFGIFLLAWGHRTTVSIEPWHIIDKWVQLIVEFYLGLNIYTANNDNKKKSKTLLGYHKLSYSICMISISDTNGHATSMNNKFWICFFYMIGSLWIGHWRQIRKSIHRLVKPTIQRSRGTPYNIPLNLFVYNR